MFNIFYRPCFEIPPHSATLKYCYCIAQCTYMYFGSETWALFTVDLIAIMFSNKVSRLIINWFHELWCAINTIAKAIPSFLLAEYVSITTVVGVSYSASRQSSGAVLVPEHVDTLACSVAKYCVFTAVLIEYRGRVSCHHFPWQFVSYCTAQPRAAPLLIHASIVALLEYAIYSWFYFT